MASSHLDERHTGSDAVADAFARTLLTRLPGRRLLVTGGSGFIGHCFVECLLRCASQDVHVYNLDSMEYCAGVQRPSMSPEEGVITDLTAGRGLDQEQNTRTSSRYHFIHGSVLDAPLIDRVLREHRIDLVVHMAAQTHVDNSFANSLAFTQVNVVGTHTLLECARQYGQLNRFLHVSTDEVYGETLETGSAASEDATVLRPTNPYAATKAAAEHLVNAYYHSFHVPTIISRGNNVYGPGQYPEKVIPKFITQALNHAKLPIQGDGHHQRSFMYVEDVARGLLTMLVRGEVGETYNLASPKEWSVCEAARRVVACVTGSEVEAARRDFDAAYVQYVPDRAYNDARYFIKSDRLAALGWEQRITFEEGLRRTVAWYRGHPLDGGYWKGS